MGTTQGSTPASNQWLRGNVSSAGAVTNGAGFTAAKLATGSYRVTFTAAFVATPAVIVQAQNASGVFGTVTTVSNASVDVMMRTDAGVAVDSGWAFIAVEVS